MRYWPFVSGCHLAPKIKTLVKNIFPPPDMPETASNLDIGIFQIANNKFAKAIAVKKQKLIFSASDHMPLVLQCVAYAIIVWRKPIPRLYSCIFEISVEFEGSI